MTGYLSCTASTASSQSYDGSVYAMADAHAGQPDAKHNDALAELRRFTVIYLVKASSKCRQSSQALYYNFLFVCKTHSLPLFNMSLQIPRLSHPPLLIPWVAMPLHGIATPLPRQLLLSIFTMVNNMAKAWYRVVNPPPLFIVVTAIVKASIPHARQRVLHLEGRRG